MALLYRFTKLNDRFNTGIFTFIVTRSVTRDLHRDATTKDFYYGYHRWAISFQRANDRALGVFLILRNPSPSTKCYADFTLTLLNREHFSRNEQHQEKQCKFTTEHTIQGVNKWIMMNEIQSRKFGDETGEFLLELSIGNIMTIFETDLQISTNGHIKSGKFESASFTFGSFEWNISIVIHNYGTTTILSINNDSNKDSNKNNDNSTNDKNSSKTETTTIPNRIIYVFLNRLSGFDHPCRVQYRVIIGLDEQKDHEDSGVLDQISDAGGRIRGFQMQHSLSDLIKSNGTVRVYVELHCCNAISEAKVPITRNPSPTINCYDRNKQGWCIEADLDSEHLRLKLFFMDLHSVPRNHLRYISWIAYVIAKDPRHGIRESLAVSNAPHSNYYVQDGIDMGAMMDTTLPVTKIKESPKVYLENEKLTVHVEWCDSIMLFNHIYHKYDDITRIHGHQMRREILALSNENYSLEKQLISYQKTIGHTVHQRSQSKDNSNGDHGKSNQQQPPQQQQQQQQQPQQQQPQKHHLHHKHHITGQRRSSSEIQLNVEHLNKINNQSSLTLFNQQQSNVQRNGHLQLDSVQQQQLSQNQQQFVPMNSRQALLQQPSIYHQHHHKLPAIPTQQHSATPPPPVSPLAQSQFHSYQTSMMMPNSPKFNALRKGSLTHYGSLPNNSSLSSFDQMPTSKYFYNEDQGEFMGSSNSNIVNTNITPSPVQPPTQSSSLSTPRIFSAIVATKRSLHRSRERNHPSATVASAAAAFSSLTSSSVPMAINQTTPSGTTSYGNNGNVQNVNGPFNAIDNDDIQYRAQLSPSLISTQQQQQHEQQQSLSLSSLRHGHPHHPHYHHNYHHQHQQPKHFHQYGNQFMNPTVIINDESCTLQQQPPQQQQPPAIMLNQNPNNIIDWTSSSSSTPSSIAAVALAATIAPSIPMIQTTTTINDTNNDNTIGGCYPMIAQQGINYP